MRFANRFLQAWSTLLWAVSALSASISREMCLPIRTFCISARPRFFMLPVTAFPCGSSISFLGITSISAWKVFIYVLFLKTMLLSRTLFSFLLAHDGLTGKFELDDR